MQKLKILLWLMRKWLKSAITGSKVPVEINGRALCGFCGYCSQLLNKQYVPNAGCEKQNKNIRQFTKLFLEILSNLTA